MFYQCLSWSNSRADSPYLPEEKLRTMLDCGQLYRGELRVNRKFPQLAFVSAGLGRDIVILGKSARNRALNGDTVAVCAKYLFRSRISFELKPSATYTDIDCP